MVSIPNERRTLSHSTGEGAGASAQMFLQPAMHPRALALGNMPVFDQFPLHPRPTSAEPGDRLARENARISGRIGMDRTGQGNGAQARNALGRPREGKKTVGRMNEIVMRQFACKARMIRPKIGVVGNVGEKLQPRRAEYRRQVTEPDMGVENFVRSLAGKIDGQVEWRVAAFRLDRGRGGKALPPFDMAARLSRARQIDQSGDADRAFGPNRRIQAGIRGGRRAFPAGN